jgi:hypothetical protein
MTDPWIAAIYIAAFIAIGAVIAVALLARARTGQARVDAEHAQRYRDLVAQHAAGQEQVAASSPA